MKWTTEPTIRNATMMPPAMAAIFNQLIRASSLDKAPRDQLSLKILPDPACAAERREYSMAMHALGIDIGGSGIKAAPVDVATGKLLAPRLKVDTPRPARPDPVADVVKKLTANINWSGSV